MAETDSNTIVAPAGAMEAACAIAREAGAILRERFGDRRSIQFKGVVDLVTDADRASETLIGARLRESFPAHRIVGEEGVANQDGAADSAGYVWIVDPLDGTTNYAHAYPHFAVSIALARGSDLVLGAVYDPMRNELFEAEFGRGAKLNGKAIHVSTIDQLIRSLLATGFAYDISERSVQLAIWNDMQGLVQGIRRDGAAALNLCYVAAGRLDGFWERPLSPWDMAAGAIIVREASGSTSSMTGVPFEVFGSEIVASNGLLHDALLSVIRGGRAADGSTLR